MAYRVRPRRRQLRKSKTPKRSSLQKPNGVISPRVQKVGGEHFAIVCVDPAKHRSEWMMADYFGNVLIEPQTLEHQGPFLKSAIEQIHQAQQRHAIEDMIVVVERTGNYYLIPKRAFAQAGFETRVIHPVATKAYRTPADPGNKTDETDLYAQHRAAAAGFGLCEFELESPYRELQLRARHRRNLVEKAAGLACQIREHMHLSLPGYTNLFDRLFERPSALAIARRCQSPAALLKLGRARLSQHLNKKKVRHQMRTLDRVFDWAAKAAEGAIQDGPLHHAVWTDLEELYQGFQRQVADLECKLAGDLVKTTYVRLLAIPGINVVSAAELAGEMGPMARYANANAITGRAGLFPSRHQSDGTDKDRGPLICQANRRLRCALMRIADNLACHCSYYRGQADADDLRGVDKRAARVKIAKRFSRLALACVAGSQPMKHPCFREPDSILEKLRHFHYLHQTPLDRVFVDLETTVEQLPYDTCGREATVVSQVLQKQTSQHRGGVAVGELMPAVLARLKMKANQEQLK